MTFVRPTILEEIPDINDYNLDVFVEFEDGYSWTVTVSTPQNFITLIDKEKMDFDGPGYPSIIVRKMTKEIIEKAVKAYPEDNAYWLKLYHFDDEIDRAVFDQLQAKHMKELKEIEIMAKLEELANQGTPKSDTDIPELE